LIDSNATLPIKGSLNPTASLEGIAIIKDRGLPRSNGSDRFTEDHPNSTRADFLDHGGHRLVAIADLDGAQDGARSAPAMTPRHACGNQSLGEQFPLIQAENHAGLFGFNGPHPGRLAQSNPKPSPLTDGESVKTFMPSQHPALTVHHLTGAGFSMKALPQDLRIRFSSCQETGILTLPLISVGQSKLPCSFTHLGLGETADGKERRIELPVIERKQEIGLILSLIPASFQ